MMKTPAKDVDMEAEMKAAFRVFDRDGSGTISLDELRNVMKSFGEILTDDELDAMIKEVDKDGDGSIDCVYPQPCLRRKFADSCVCRPGVRELYDERLNWRLKG